MIPHAHHPRDGRRDRFDLLHELIQNTGRASCNHGREKATCGAAKCVRRKSVAERRTQPKCSQTTAEGRQPVAAARMEHLRVLRHGTA